MATSGLVYSPSSAEGQLRQGEIISNLTQVRIALTSIDAETNREAVDIVHPFAIVITQDCDLEQDYKVRYEAGDSQHRLLPSVLLCEAEIANEVRQGKQNPNLSEDKRVRSQKITSDIWKSILGNNDERFQFLQSVDAVEDGLNQGIPALIIEFKRYFTLPTDELYHRLRNPGQAQRRCSLKSPYLEHFSTRFHNYHQRIALPENHSGL